MFNYDELHHNFRLADGISFHFFTSHPPCGDGSIFNGLIGKKAKRAKLDEDIVNEEQVGVALRVDGFTGGKLLDVDAGDSDLMAQRLGAVRTKPGRGIRTLSVSCSDKMSRWSFAGIQGAMLMTLLAKPIYLDSISVCGACDVEAIERAVWKRWNGCSGTDSKRFALYQPIVQRTSSRMVFEHEQADGLQPAPSSIVWCLVNERLVAGSFI